MCTDHLCYKYLSTNDYKFARPYYKDWGYIAESVNYVGLIPYLISAIKEKISEINDSL